MKKTLLSGMCAWTMFAFAHAETNTPVQVSVTPVTGSILKLSWGAIPGRQYLIQHASSLLNNSWQNFSVEQSVETPSRRSIVIDRANDFFRVCMLPLTNSNPATANLVTNGDFEIAGSSNPLHWNRGGFGSNTRIFLYPVLGMGGSHAASLTISNWQSGDGKWYFDDIPVVTSNTYHLSFWYTSSVRCDATVRYAMTNGTFVYNGLLLPSASSVWTNAEVTFTPPAGAQSMTIFHALTTNGTLVVDNVSITNVPPPPTLAEGMVSLDFDDGWEETSQNARAILEPVGMHGTFNIVTSRVNGQGVVQSQEVIWLWQAGHEIGGHTIDHTNLLDLDEKSVETEINLSRQTLMSWGVGPINSFVYPFGAYDAHLEKLVREAGYLSGGSTDSGLNAKSSFDRYALKRTSIRSYMTIQDVDSMIDDALAQKQWLILTFHHVDSTTTDYSVPPAFLQQVVDHLLAKNALVVTASEGMQLMTSP